MQEIELLAIRDEEQNLNHCSDSMSFLSFLSRSGAESIP